MKTNVKSSEKAKKSFFRKNSDKFVVILIIGICAVMASLEFLDKFETKVYDQMLKLHQNPGDRNELLIVEIDDESTTLLGAWPWSRDIYADQLLRMKELGADTAVFDIEFLSPSNMIVTKDDKDVMAKNFEEFAEVMMSNPEDASVENLYFSLDELLFKDNDKYFASAIQFFGNTWLTINYIDIGSALTEDEKQYAYDYCLYKIVSDPEDLIKKCNTINHLERGEAKGFFPAMHTFLKHSKGAGFTNVLIDKDGTRRNLQLLEKESNGYVAQLAVAPLLKKYDVQQVVRHKNSIEFIGVKEDNKSERYNIKIPLDNKGRFFINWKHENFNNSFKHTFISRLNELDWTENNILAQLENFGYWYIFGNGGYSADFAYSAEARNLIEEHKEIEEFKKYLLEKCLGFEADGTAIDGGISDMEYEMYFSARNDFFKHVDEYFANDYFDELYDFLHELVEDDDIFKSVQEEIRADVLDLGENISFYKRSFKNLQKLYNGAYCLIGNTTSSTTDLGITPFERAYPNIGTHANVYNTIMTQDFITPLPWWVGIIIASIIAMALAFFSENRKVNQITIAGIFALGISIAIPILAMAFTGVYIQLLWGSILMAVTFVTLIIIHFFRSEKDKSFLKHAFATYLNPKSVNEIIEHPEKLSLGGEQKHLTALFSDIQKFSSFSESVTPEKLVAVLKTYLGNMSDCILDEGGTIDKYEGDAIIAFFGAPAELENAAYSACASAIRMKQAEKLYNDEHTKTGFLDRELNTRIGINTGEMVVGNMGTDKKFNYTIMGNDVNLASRLEGVNKAYKSWILTSEATWNEANSGKYEGKIVARRFDRVRVVNIDKPVQLYNILGFREEMTEVQLKAADIFEEAMKLYLDRKFTEAAALFTQANQLVPEDQSPLVFAARCKEYAVSGVPEKWTGVTTLTSK